MGKNSLAFPPKIIGSPTETTIVLGCSPLVYARQFGVKSTTIYKNHFQGKPDAMAEVWTAFAEAGGKVIHLVDDDALCSAFESWRGKWPFLEVWLTIAGEDIEELCCWLASINGTRVFRHARQVDAGEDLSRFVAASLACGLKPGIATHSPGRTTTYSRCINDHPLAIMTPFNYRGDFMDIKPEDLYNRLINYHDNIAVMMTLAAGRIPLRNGAAFAALHFRTLIIGTGNPLHANELARIGPLLDVVRSGATFAHRKNPYVDISDSTYEVIFMLNHKGLRLSGAAAEIWHKLSSPHSIEDLLKWSTLKSCLPPYTLLPELAGCITALLDWGVIAPQERL